MKKAAIAMLVGSAFGLVACQPQAVDPLKVDAVALETDAQKQAYAMGANVGEFIEQRVSELEEAGIEFDKTLLVQGFVAALQGQSQMDKQEAQAQLASLESVMREAKQAADAAASAKNLEDGKAYLAENAKREGVTVTDSGLQYEVLTAAEGAKPNAQDTVKVHYRGTLLDGTEFDSSYSRGQPASFPLHRVISGWTEGLQLMNVGSKFKFHIPSELAYGARATGKITSNSTLIFEVELLEIVGAQPSSQPSDQ